MPESSARFDPIITELVRNGIGSVVDEMVTIIVRTAYSGVIKENMDFSTGFCGPQGDLIAQGLSLPLHLGAIPDAMAAVLNRYGDEVEPGDVFVMNDPYEGGMHLPDIFMFRPVYIEGELLGYAACVCHHSDVGGRVPGSNASDSTEIYQEGLRLPPIRLLRAGRENEELLRLIAKNVRLPEAVLGDLRAQMAACHAAEQEVTKLAERFGLARLADLLRWQIDYAEARTRAAIAELPDGVFKFTDYLDDDGIDEGPLPIEVELVIAGDQMRFDYSGSAPQARGAINATLSFTKAATYAAVRYVIGADIPTNAGFFQPIDVHAPAGTILNVVPPGACAARGVTGFRVGDAALGALAQALPNRVFAASEGGNTCVTIGGYKKDRSPFVFVDFSCSSWGARPDADGIDGITNPFQNLANQSIEIVECEQPIRIERYAFIPDSGGAGRFRGGLGIVRDYRLVDQAEAVLQVRSDRRDHPPYGLSGGRPGARSANFLRSVTAPEAPELLPTKFIREIATDDLLSIQLPGGGGFGEPFERDPELVAADVRLGKVSEAAALAEYGVVLDEAGAVDWDETRRRRGESRR